jgi:hypothetical protein
VGLDLLKHDAHDGKNRDLSNLDLGAKTSILRFPRGGLTAELRTKSKAVTNHRSPDAEMIEQACYREEQIGTLGC